MVNPNFGLTTRTIGQTTIRVYTQTVASGVTADKAATALIGLNQAFGPYPWPDLVLAEVGAVDGFSMEYPRAIHLTRSKATDTYVINHEVAHQWFYAQLGNHQMLEPWLDEAFADFSARYLMGIGPSQLLLAGRGQLRVRLGGGAHCRWRLAELRRLLPHRLLQGDRISQRCPLRDG